MIHRLHPGIVFLYFIGILVLSMCTLNPIFLALSFLGALLLLLQISPKKGRGKRIIFYALVFLLTSFTNPLISHNGETVLFFFNGQRITLEAFYRGLGNAGLLLSSLLWCRCLTLVMTTDKVLYLFGRFHPKTALTLSRAIRLFPEAVQYGKEIYRTQRILAAPKGLLQKLRALLSSFSALIGFMLENAVLTADSMRARGYGIGDRTSFSLYPFRLMDKAMFFGLAAFLVITAVPVFRDGFYYYPTISPLPNSLLAYALFGIYALAPTILEIKEEILWKYYRSKI